MDALKIIQVYRVADQYVANLCGIFLCFSLEVCLRGATIAVLKTLHLLGITLIIAASFYYKL